MDFPFLGVVFGFVVLFGLFSVCQGWDLLTFDFGCFDLVVCGGIGVGLWCLGLV